MRVGTGWALTAALAVAGGASAQEGFLKIFGRPKSDGQPEKAIPTPVQKVATVNGEAVNREELAEELIAAFGKEQIESIINRRLIEQACRKAHVEITREELEKELNDTLTNLKVSRTEFRDRVLAQQNMTLLQYMRDTVWPKVAIKKLAAPKVKVTDEDIMKSFEATFGEKVEIRMLAVAELRKATELWNRLMAVEDPKLRLEQFEDIAKKHSIDEATRQYGGACEPICKHCGFPDIEEMVFKLKDGDLSTVRQIPNGHMFVLRVRAVPANKEVTLETKNKDAKKTIRDLLYEDIYVKKLKFEGGKIFEELRREAKIVNFLTKEIDDTDDLIEPRAPAARTKSAQGGKPAAGTAGAGN
jgi:hypothetical protein